MLKIVTSIVILSSAFMLGHCTERESEVSAITELNNYLERNNVIPDEVISALARVPWFRNSPKVKLARQVSSLIPMNQKNFCVETNLDNLRNTMATMVGIDKESLQANNIQLPLNSFLRAYIEKALKKCLNKIEMNFVHHISVRYASSIHGLSWNISYGFRLPGKIKYSNYVAKEFDKSKLRLMVKHMYCHIKKLEPCVLKIDNETGKEAKLTFEEAKAYLNDYLFVPCKLFLEDKEIQNILGPAIALTEAALMAEYYPRFLDYNFSLHWASAALACKSLKDGDLTKFANIISK